VLWITASISKMKKGKGGQTEGKEEGKENDFLNQ
jgi:hypothetical protein